MSTPGRDLPERPERMTPRFGRNGVLLSPSGYALHPTSTVFWIGTMLMLFGVGWLGTQSLLALFGDRNVDLSLLPAVPAVAGFALILTDIKRLFGPQAADDVLRHGFDSIEEYEQWATTR